MQDNFAFGQSILFLYKLGKYFTSLTPARRNQKQYKLSNTELHIMVTLKAGLIHCTFIDT